MRMSLRGERIFQPVYAALICPTPIKILAVFATENKLREEFEHAADQIKLWGRDFKVNHTNRTIDTPIGSRVFFKCGVNALQGMEVHDYWVDESIEYDPEMLNLVSCRARL